MFSVFFAVLWWMLVLFDIEKNGFFIEDFFVKNRFFEIVYNRLFIVLCLISVYWCKLLKLGRLTFKFYLYL